MKNIHFPSGSKESTFVNIYKKLGLNGFLKCPLCNELTHEADWKNHVATCSQRLNYK